MANIKLTDQVVDITGGGTSGTTAAEARANLNVVNKSGDTMTGTLTINNANPCIWLIDNNDIDTAPSSTVNSNNIYWKDKNGKQYGLVRSRQFTNGRYGMWFAATRKDGNVANGIELYYDQNDNPAVILAYPAAWRDALGLAATAFTLTRNTTNTEGGAAYGIYDPGANTVRIYGRANKTGGIPLSSQMFSIPSAYRPSTAKYGICVVNYSGGLGVGGIEVKANGDMTQVFSASSTTLFFFIEYTL